MSSVEEGEVESQRQTRNNILGDQPRCVAEGAGECILALNRWLCDFITSLVPIEESLNMTLALEV